MNNNFLLIQLNEINFELVDKYISSSKLKKFTNLRSLRESYKFFNTHSENEYENLEPWIQWVSINLGKDFKQHKIFRLGDIVNHPKEKQIFEKIESKGYKVGAISPMNTENRLNEPAYFIPDPWTNTHSDNSSFSKRISLMLKQTVNDNASGGITLKSYLTILETIIRTFHFGRTLTLFKLIFSSKKKPWKKSLVLEYLIHVIHIYFLKKKLPNFSSVFLNAGAHIQHHYLFNSKHLNDLPKNPKWYVDFTHDPIEEMLEVYDQIIGDYLKMSKNGSQLFISTGLRQVPYDQNKFYYRLKNHSTFLSKVGIKYLNVFPRMTRDFEITFQNKQDLINAKNVLESTYLKKNNLKIFNEIDERNKSLFVSLTYPHEILKEDEIITKDQKKLNFLEEVIFVAIKNGMHDSKGYVFYSPNLDLKNPKESIHVSKLHEIILSFFKKF